MVSVYVTLHSKLPNMMKCKCLEWAEQIDVYVKDRWGGEVVGRGGKSQVKSTGFPNTLVPCQPAQMTDTACLFLASSFSWRSSLRAWWKAVAVVEEFNFSVIQNLIAPGEVLSRCEKALWGNTDERQQQMSRDGRHLSNSKWCSCSVTLHMGRI